MKHDLLRKSLKDILIRGLVDQLCRLFTRNKRKKKATFKGRVSERSRNINHFDCNQAECPGRMTTAENQPWANTNK